MQVLSGHTGRVHDLAFSPDGGLLASSGGDGAVRVWDLSSGEGRVLVRGRLIRGRAATGPVAFTADGRRVLARHAGGGLTAWDVASARHAATLMPSSTGLYTTGLAAAPGTAAANEWLPGADAPLVRVWDTATWQRRATHWAGDGSDSAGLAFDPAGGRLATNAGVLDAATGARLVEAHFPGDALEWSPDGALIACSGEDHEVQVHRADTGEPVATVTAGRPASDLAFSADGTCLAVVSGEEVVRVWDARDWSQRPSLAWRIGRLRCVAFAPDGHRAACAGRRGDILVWDWDG